MNCQRLPLPPQVASESLRPTGRTWIQQIALLVFAVALAPLSPVLGGEGLDAVVGVLAEVDDVVVQRDLLAGTLRGLAGRRRVAMPQSWPAAYRRLSESPSSAVREQALELAVLFDDPQAFARLRARVVDRTQGPALRQHAIGVLAGRKDAKLPELLLSQIGDVATRRAAIVGLAEFNEPRTASVILDHYSQLDAPTKQDALQTLASRRAWASQLLDAMQAGRIPRGDLTAFTARQIDSLGDSDVAKRLGVVWGRVGSTSQQKARQITAYAKYLTKSQREKADLPAGRQLYVKTCANCHRLFGEGGRIGPDITGAQRHNLDYLLENVVDPNAAVSKDYQMEVLATADGRVITGLVVADDESTITVQTATQKVILPVDEVERRKPSSLSLMPEGLLQKLSRREIRDLMGYLSSPRQVPLPESPNSDDSSN